jgi:23S rRNA (cytosine1962-C5)-methyltransferase
MTLPRLRIQKGKDAAIRKGCPWVFAGDIIPSSELALLEKGAAVDVRDARDQFIGIGYYNHAAQLACRILTYRQEYIDDAFFERAFSQAIKRRKALAESKYLRLVHAEADGLAGLIVDQFGDVLSVQVGTAGMDKLQEYWIAALHKILAPRSILLRSDAPAHEAITKAVRVIGEPIDDIVAVQQNGVTYYADLLHGQKTGWYFDQRDNHALFASFCEGKTVLDMYAHSGGFGLLAAARGATHVTMADRSDAALALAKKAAPANSTFITGDAFAVMEQLHAEGKIFDCISVDPPPFIKTKNDIASGMKGYEKASFLAARLAASGGILMVASCSHHASKSKFYDAVTHGIKRAGRTATILHKTGASPDHPVHPHLPQTEYLKSILLRMD